ncbi:hypothetical protein A1359_08395 [Methylomonas lenta]|uniref:Beta-lactamase-inhibitor-like PepSY-like domain-containing protein n=1 Tax=Methylomonas lenta TaxID=980561 RepID=A0A177NES0_9GAMM|nr:hypothetical protein [Methylomonas lenta]OAI16351.1 hypothetical protein A1359_08395 [Methylomonas lenta]
MFYAKFLIALLMVLFHLNTAVAAEITQVKFDSLPEAVKKTTLAIIDQKDISKLSQINDNNLIRFEIEADKTENNQDVVALELVIASNGKLMKLAKEVPYYALSYPQMQEIEKRYPGIKVTEAESVDLHFYDVVGNINGLAINFRLYEDGLIEDQSK